ncbi:DUF6461 domain-containing protein [Streptomyces albidoflavus]
MTIRALFPNSQLYGTGYCAILARGISPAEILARVSGRDFHPIYLNRFEAEIIKALGEDIDEADIPDLDLDELHSNGFLEDSGPLLRAGVHDDWSFVIESEGPYLASEKLLKTASRDTVALSARVTETGSTWISYAENGEILSSFDPLFPEYDSGSHPSALDELTHHREAIRRGERSDSFENALRAIQKELHCAIPQEVDALRLISTRIAGVYS